ncbi:MAG: pyruvate kinase [Defluviitaleaceae bacterium]|nr:pyruvate kinase [Defluviitaleaceae bacterium]
MFLYTLHAKDNIEKIKHYLHIGARNFRINFGRNTFENNIKQLKVLSNITDDFFNIRVFFDLPGSKIRLGKFNHGKIDCICGRTIKITSQIVDGNAKICSFKDRFYIHFKVGDELILGSGLKLKIIEKTPSHYIAEFLSDGYVYNYCGIASKNRYLPHESLADEEIKILNAISNCNDIKVDYICPSFTDCANIIKETNVHYVKPVNIIAKIESPVGVERINEIAEVACGLMLCRGDLSTFFTHEEIYKIGKKISDVCKQKNKIFAVATDFFVNYISTGFFSENEQIVLKSYMQLEPNYILINETCYSENWAEIVSICIGAIK